MFKDPIEDAPQCPSHDCGCPGCSIKCAGCNRPLLDSPLVVVSGRYYCVPPDADCAQLALDAQAQAVLLLLRGARENSAVWNELSYEDARPRMNAALHLTRPGVRPGARLWPTSVPEDQFEVIVGNIGTVYSGTDEQNARRDFEHYVWLSKYPAGRASGEAVVIIKNYRDIIAEYEGENRDE